MEDSKLENILRNVAIVIGVILLIGSIYLSYDGFDQNVGDGNSQYGILAASIGVALAVAVSLLQFIVSSRLDGLNTTLKILGLGAYAYSIGTNFLGAQNILHMDTMAAAITALFMDIVPEPLIAWGLGEAVMHDLFGNLGKIASSSPAKRGKGGGGGGNNNHGGGGNQQGKHGGQQNRPAMQFQGSYRPSNQGGGNRPAGPSGDNGHNKPVMAGVPKGVGREELMKRYGQPLRKDEEEDDE